MLLHHEFIKVAKKNGEKPAYIDKSTGRTIPYSKALIASLMLAEKFKAYDEGFIGLMIPTSAGCGLAMLGAIMSGRTPVMINYSTGAANNAEFAQKKCAFKTIIASKALVEKINCRFVPGMIFIEDIMASINIADKLKAALRSKLPLPILTRSVYQGTEDDNIVILFTSGSEKDPKAVQLTHKNISANLEGIHNAITFIDEDIFLANLPYFHVFGLTANFWLPLLRGLTIVSYANPLEFRTICDIVRDEKVTLVCGTPTFLLGYLHKSEPGDFKTIRIMLSGADKCPDALRKGYTEKHNITLLEGYGATETSPVISINSPAHNRPGSVGRALSNVKIRIENYETGEECKIGETGKILVKGNFVMKGYFDDFEETALHIRHGWYDTGDMGIMDNDGYLWHVGRLRRFMKIGGEMVSLIRVENELEKALAKFGSEDVECCVVEVPDAMRGAKIVAVLTHQVDDKKILKEMTEHLPNIALPKQFIVMEEMPKMGSGKIDFRTLTERVRDKMQAV